MARPFAQWSETLRVQQETVITGHKQTMLNLETLFNCRVSTYKCWDENFLFYLTLVRRAPTFHSSQLSVNTKYHFLLHLSQEQLDGPLLYVLNFIFGFVRNYWPSKIYLILPLDAWFGNLEPLH